MWHLPAKSDLIFLRKEMRQVAAKRATDWDLYYRSVPITAHLTRRYTQSVLISLMRRFTRDRGEPAALIEIGGANSCFLDAILAAIRPRAYHVIDRNRYGLSLLEKRLHGRGDVFLHQADVLQLKSEGLRGDLVFSIGLVEHFDPEGTWRAIRAHFDLLYTGGYAIISFPTPTLLYRTARAIVEALGAWKFPDERPLQPEEVRDAVSDFGEVVFEKILWPLILTQHLIVVRKTVTP
jgi:hypothetical protein